MNILLIFLVTAASADLIINTTNGPIQGIPSFAEDVEAYLGVPYAEPPVGDRRFAKPVPKENWLNIYHASGLPPPCPQFGMGPFHFLPDISNMSEDCLYLNVWAPKNKPTKGLRPIIIYFHPGAFTVGSTSIRGHDGSHFASRGDLIVVTLNYRLGAFGYLSADIEEANGNMGLFDQLMAIKWMKNNAEAFYGDPDNIVLMGLSAGAFSVSAHIVSPFSKNLFKRAIVESGSLIQPLFNDNTKLLKNTEDFVSIVGCSDATSTLKTDPLTVVKCLKAKSMEDLVEGERVLSKIQGAMFYPRSNDEFLPKSVNDLIQEGSFRNDLELLTGIAEDEGTILLLVAIPEYLGHNGKKEFTLNKFRARTFAHGIVLLSDQSNVSEVVDYYMKQVKKPTKTGYLRAVSSIVGDFGVACNTVFLADLISLKGNAVFFYKFGFRAASTPTAEWVGVTHADEIQYVFGSPYYKNFTDEELELSHRLIDRWSAFARSGNPNIPGQIQWLRYSYQNPLYIHFGQEEESIRLKPNKRCEIWRKRYDAEIDTTLIQHLKKSVVDKLSTDED